MTNFIPKIDSRAKARPNYQSKLMANTPHLAQKEQQQLMLVSQPIRTVQCRLWILIWKAKTAWFYHKSLRKLTLHTKDRKWCKLGIRQQINHIMPESQKKVNLLTTARCVKAYHSIDRRMEWVPIVHLKVTLKYQPYLIVSKDFRITHSDL